MLINIDELALHTPTWAEIDLDALRANYANIRERAPQSRVIAVVKSDGYGHGASTISRELESAGVDFFAVATAAEAVSLRTSGVRAKILLLNGITPQQIPLIYEFDLIPTLHTIELIEDLTAFAKLRSSPITVHLKVDTGMGRLGFDLPEAGRILEKRNPWLRYEAVLTHFACADEVNDDYTKQQIRKFEHFLHSHQTHVEFVHAANSAAIINYPQSHYDFVRPGLLLYGISPAPNTLDFQPILTLKSKIIFLQKIKKGQAIGYGCTFRANRASLIATAPIGYNDGLRRMLSNRLYVELHGKKCPVAGTISMDLCMIDATDVARKVRLYDEVTFLGPSVDAWEWSRILGTIPYEVTCLIGNRVPRVYYKDDRIVDVYYR